MDIEKKIRNYQFFFDFQVKEAEVEQKTIAKTPIGQLLRKEELTIGYVDHLNVERGHVVLKFPKDKGPRLKVLKSMMVIKKTAFTEQGIHPRDWTCSLIEFSKKAEYHSISSDLVPLYYLRRNDPNYDYVGCSSVSLVLFDLFKSALAKGKSLSVLVYTPFPPVDYYKNMNSFMDMNIDNEELCIEPKIAYEDWHPEELSYNPEDEELIARTIIETLDKDNVCVLQGPPGTGKSYTIAQIISHYLNLGQTACATTMANKGLIELAQQPPLKELLEAGRISKTNLSADEEKQVKGLKRTQKGLIVPTGELLCSTNYVLSHAFNPKNVAEHGLPSYDLVVIEEASQAFLTSIIAFKSLGKKCLIVGDPMQLPPIVSSANRNEFKGWNANTQIDGLKTFALGTDVKSYRIVTTFRLTKASAQLTSLFYSNNFTSVQRKQLDYSTLSSPLFPNEGGTIYYFTDDFTNGVCSDTALSLIDYVIGELGRHYAKRSIAVISPFNDTVKHLQKAFLTDGGAKDLTIETIDRIQGMTVDYAILYIPGRNPGFALDERRFNVATSRSRSTTLIVSDIPLEQFHSVSALVKLYISRSKRIEVSIGNSRLDEESINNIKLLYPGLEHIVDELLENRIEFSYDGDVDLTDSHDVVLASAGMVLRKQMIAIDPVDDASRLVFESAGYKIMDSSTFNIKELK